MSESMAATPAQATPSTVQEFLDVHDVHRAFVPFEYRSVDVIETLTEIRGYVDGLRETRSLFRTMEVIDALDLTIYQVGRFLDTFLYSLGSWPSDYQSFARGQRWVNPNYVHLPGYESIDEDAARREYLATVADLGLFEPADLTKPLGVETAGDVRHTIDRLDFDFHQRRDEGRAKVARAWKLASEWGHTDDEIAVAFDQSAETVSEWQVTYAADFDVPADPSGQEGFYGEGGGS